MSGVVGDTDYRALLGQRLQALAQHLGTTIDVTSGRRTLREQAYLYRNRASNPYPVAAPTPNDPHVEGVAADATINGSPIQNVVSPETLKQFGLEPLAGDAVHIQLAGTVGKSAAEIKQMALGGAFASKGSSGGGGILGTGIGVGDIASHVSPIGIAVNAGEEIAGAAGEVLPSASEIASSVLEGLAKALGINAPAILLNIGLVGGGAWMIYYGVSLMAGVQEPNRKLLELAKSGPQAAAAAAVVK